MAIVIRCGNRVAHEVSLRAATPVSGKRERREAFEVKKYWCSRPIGPGHTRHERLKNAEKLGCMRRGCLGTGMAGLGHGSPKFSSCSCHLKAKVLLTWCSRVWHVDDEEEEMVREERTLSSLK